MKPFHAVVVKKAKAPAGERVTNMLFLWLKLTSVAENATWPFFTVARHEERDNLTNMHFNCLSPDGFDAFSPRQHDCTNIHSGNGKNKPACSVDFTHLSILDLLRDEIFFVMIISPPADDITCGTLRLPCHVLRWSC